MRSATRSASPAASGRTAERCSSGRGTPHIMTSVRLCGRPDADDAAAAQGHGYMEAGGAIVGILLVAACAQRLSTLARRRFPSTWRRLWLTASCLGLWILSAAMQG